MIHSWKELDSFFKTHTVNQYSRTAWDAFLKHVHFDYPIPSIHITGTNGKGSTALKLHDIYRLSGLKVGLYTSPAIESYVEMIQINGVPISETTLLAMVNEFLPLFETFHLTTFEMQTYVAFMYFIREGCTFSVIEVGMGGLTDATNVFIPVLSILTNVTLEHQAYLGKTIEAIAFQKAGIIKPNIPVLVGPRMHEQALRVIAQQAKVNHAPLTRAVPVSDVDEKAGLTITWSKEAYALNTLARYQIENAATVLQAVTLLQPSFPVQPMHIEQAFALPWLPGRFEKLTIENKTIILDGAHNPGAIMELISCFSSPPSQVLFACFSDKDFSSMWQAMKQAQWNVTVTTFDHVRAQTSDDYSNDIPYIQNPFFAVESLIKGTPKNGVLLITGSLAFIGIMRTYLKGKYFHVANN